MKELTTQELREVQLQIMDYVDHFCRVNSIQYTLSCGTLLGAVRHGGFIPWDDDIDIHLLRNEYVKFTQLWNSSTDKHPYELISIESGNNMGYPFGKVHDPRTVTYVGNLERTGVFIDVFPVDYVVDIEDFNLRHRKIVELYKKRDRKFAWMVARVSNDSCWRKLKAFFLQPAKNYNDIAVEISNLAQTIPCRTSFIYEMVQGLFPKSLIPADVYDNYKDIVFENRVFRSVCDTDTYLVKTYGDWRTLPPIEKRVAHHAFKAYWKEKR